MSLYYDGGVRGKTVWIIDPEERANLIQSIDEAYSILEQNPDNFSDEDKDILDPFKLRKQITTVEQGGDEVDPYLSQIKKLNIALHHANLKGFREKPRLDDDDTLVSSSFVGQRCANVRKRKEKNDVVYAVYKPMGGFNEPLPDSWTDHFEKQEEVKTLLLTLNSDNFDRSAYGNDDVFVDGLQFLFELLKENGMYAELKLYGKREE